MSTHRDDLARAERIGTPRSYFGAQVLILLAAALFGGEALSGGGKQSLSERVGKIVHDEARRAVAVQHAQTIESLLRTSSSQFTAFRNATATALRTVGLDSTAYGAQLEEGLDRSQELELQVLEERFLMREAMTREEWNELFAQLRKAGGGLHSEPAR